MLNTTNFSALGSNSLSDSYTDLASLHAIRELGRDNKNQALEKVAEQFESMMVRMMMKSMRSANEVFAEGNFLSSHEGDMYQGMFDDQMALSLSQGRGMGVADVMVRQLQQRFGTVSETHSDIELKDYLKVRNHAQGLTHGVVVEKKTNTVAVVKRDFKFDGSIQQFVEKLMPLAEKAAKKLGVSPDVLIAQAALETGWGNKITTMGDRSSFNLFNIKADKRWQGSTMTVATLEIKQGIPVKEFAAFRVYQSPEQSFEDYVEFISSSPRYEEALQAGNSEEYIQALQEAGYATDPHYSDKVLHILNSEDIQLAVRAQNESQHRRNQLVLAEH